MECAPLDTEILTQYGWKHYNELVVGERVLGYNIETGRCEWTELRAVNLMPQREVVTYKNNNFLVRCPRNHRWAMEFEARGGPNPNSLDPKQYSKRKRGMGVIDDAISDWRRARIIQAAPAPDGTGLKVHEHLEMCDRPNAVSKVLKMTSEQRRAFIYGMMLGEGTIARNQQGRGGLSFTQNPGPVLEAFRLACFLEGIATSQVRRTRKIMNGEERVCARVTLLRKPHRMVTSMIETRSTVEDTWCPTTGLGTWVMRQGDIISITGNCPQGGEKPAPILFGH